MKTYRLLERNEITKKLIWTAQHVTDKRLRAQATYQTLQSFPVFLIAALQPLHIHISSSTSFALKSYVYANLRVAALCRSLGLACLRLNHALESRVLARLRGDQSGK
jgi:hypothetical protein